MISIAKLAFIAELLSWVELLLVTYFVISSVRMRHMRGSLHCLPHLNGYFQFFVFFQNQNYPLTDTTDSYNLDYCRMQSKSGLMYTAWEELNTNSYDPGMMSPHYFGHQKPRKMCQEGSAQGWNKLNSVQIRKHGHLIISSTWTYLSATENKIVSRSASNWTLTGLKQHILQQICSDTFQQHGTSLLLDWCRRSLAI